jgi:N-acetylglucosamine-6-phosphate deacetylase
MFMVTDCHASAGTDMSEFELTGRKIYVKDGMCTDKEGHLSGSNIMMDQGLKNCVLSC